MEGDLSWDPRKTWTTWKQKGAFPSFLPKREPPGLWPKAVGKANLEQRKLEMGKGQGARLIQGAFTGAGKVMPGACKVQGERVRVGETENTSMRKTAAVQITANTTRLQRLIWSPLSPAWGATARTGPGILLVLRVSDISDKSPKTQRTPAMTRGYMSKG